LLAREDDPFGAMENVELAITERWRPKKSIKISSWRLTKGKFSKITRGKDKKQRRNPYDGRHCESYAVRRWV